MTAFKPGDSVVIRNNPHHEDARNCCVCRLGPDRLRNVTTIPAHGSLDFCCARHREVSRWTVSSKSSVQSPVIENRWSRDSWTHRCSLTPRQQVSS